VYEKFFLVPDEYYVGEIFEIRSYIYIFANDTGHFGDILPANLLTGSSTQSQPRTTTRNRKNIQHNY